MILRKIFICIIDLYRRFISPLKPPCCRFTPSCSAYAREAIDIHGALIGSLLATCRILRCNPFCRSGYDPPPEKGQAIRYLFSKDKVRPPNGK